MSPSPPHKPSKATQEGDEEKKTKKILTAVDEQKRQLERLMKDPSKLVHLPNATRAKRPPKMGEFQHNIQGSVAGAGSGEFHVYRAHRRREMTRINLMEEEARKQREEKEFQEKLASLRSEDESKTAKRRAKRQKRKHGAKKQNNEEAQEGSGVQDEAKSLKIGQDRVESEASDEISQPSAKAKVAKPNVMTIEE
ncbi:hypothetical protein BJ684DRAFT_19350 [Piptocephalis cylindrospora]|uniref:DUF1168-domain-containing protein n=1 Tax=Piptocephalis cylindrospora TaxID=1907219 RepID=A0A4P9Y5J4_9FUNG|nr:hypothetical protein BJ684DRAFT_19350 [Piptocephalis cylindrospora]|eukprot:RKP14225.1 hypothetical protein BJ684DRAFT_19350 [Piptocephalis cylindrospora]